MIAPAGGIHLRCAAKLGERCDEGIVEHPAVEQVFEQRAVSLIVHRRDDVLHSLNAGERFRAVDVPGDFVEHGDECIQRDEAHASLDEPPREQTIAGVGGLSRIGSVSGQRLGRFLRQVGEFGHAGLRAKGGFVGGDATRDRRRQFGPAESFHPRPVEERLIVERRIAFSVENRLHLRHEHLGLEQLAIARKPEKFGVGHRGPQEIREPRGERMGTERRLPGFAGAFKRSSVVGPAR